MTDEALVTVAKFGNLPEAQSVQLYLEAEGITTFLADAETIAMDWLLANAVGDIKLQVAAADAKAATALIAQMQAKRARREQFPEEDEKTTCLACGAELSDEAAQCAKCGWSYGETLEAE